MKKIVRNVILQSPLTGAFYFVPKGEDLGNGVTRVIGRKVDVTVSINAIFGGLTRLARGAPKRRAKKVSTSKPAPRPETR